MVDGASNYINRLSETNGSRTVLLLAPKRLEIAFGFLLIDLRPTRRSDDLAAAADTTAAGRDAKERRVLPPETDNGAGA